MTGCGLFLIFNVISGRLFLGDAGAYGLAAGVALANSLTGLSIASASARIALAGYLGAWWPITGSE